MNNIRRLAIAAQRCFKGGEGQFAAAQGALKRVLVYLGDQILLADHDTGLWAAENLVAAERHHVGAGLNALGHYGFFRQAVAAQINQRAAAEVLHHRQVVFFADGDHLLEGNFGGEADDFVVAGVHFEQQRGAVADRVLVIRRMGAVGGADFSQYRAAFGHDFGYAKGAADFDQLAARDDDFLAFGEGVQAQQDCGGIVVDHGSRFGAGQFHQQFHQRFFAPPAPARREIVFEIDRVGGDGGHRVDGGLREQGAAQVGMKDRARGVNHAHMAGPAVQGNPTLDPLQNRGLAYVRRAASAAANFSAQLIQNGAALRGDVVAVVTREQHVAARVLEQAIDGRKHAQQVGGWFGGHEESKVCTAPIQFQHRMTRGRDTDSVV